MTAEALEALAPADEAELSEALKGASGPLAISGGATRGQADSLGGTQLSTARISGITLYEPGALTLVARAGTPLEEIVAAIGEKGQMLAFEPRRLGRITGAEGRSTLGGVIATNSSGPRRVFAGAARDYILGARFVDGAGRAISSGGRVMKNVTGYDLARMQAGAHGTLGVLTEVSLKVLPAPETTASLFAEGLDPARAVQAMAVALASPFEVSGAVHHATQAGTTTRLRLEGFELQVAGRAERLRSRLASFGDWEILRDGQADSWARVRDLEMLAEGSGDVWRVSVKASEAARVVAAAGAEDALLDWGGGQVWLRMAEGTDLRARLADVPSHATIVHAAPETRTRLGVFPGEAPGVAALSGGLRRRFDPRGILNPGLMA